MNLLSKLFLLLSMGFAMQSVYAMEQDLMLLEQQLATLAYAQPTLEELSDLSAAFSPAVSAEASCEGWELWSKGSAEEEDVTETPDILTYIEGEGSDGSESESEEEFAEAQEAPENLAEEKSEAEQLQDLFANESPERRSFFEKYSRLLQALDNIAKQLDSQQESVMEINQKVQEAEALISRFRRDNRNNPDWTDIIDAQLTPMLQEIVSKAKGKAENLTKLKENLFKLSEKLTEAESVLLASKVKQTAKSLWSSVSSWFGTTTEPQPETMAKARFLTAEAERMFNKIKQDYRLTDESSLLAASTKRLRELQAELQPAQAAPPVNQAAALPTAQPVIEPPTTTLVAQEAEQQSSSELKRQSSLPVAQPVKQKQ